MFRNFIFLFACCLITASNAHALSLKYEVDFPNPEGKTYSIDSPITNVRLPKSPWKCIIKRGNPNYGIGGFYAVVLEIECKKGKDTIWTTGTCVNVEGELQSPPILSIDSNGVDYQIHVLCNGVF